MAKFQGLLCLDFACKDDFSFLMLLDPANFSEMESGAFVSKSE